MPACIRICFSYCLSGGGTGKTGVSAGDRHRLAERRTKVYSVDAFTGSDGAQIHTAYEATREQYLDIGHVKAIIFGTSLRENRERLREVLTGMESESSLGNSLCIFTTDSLSELSQAVEEQGISLGDFLTGLYENRTDSSAQTPVRLADLYRSCHTDTALPQIPGITVKDRVLMVEKK